MTYDLVLEGLSSQDSAAIQRVKAILIADLELTVAEAHSALSDPPFVLLTGTNKGMLQDYAQSLAEAGALVKIEPTDSGSPISDDDDVEFVFDLDLDEEAAAADLPKPTAKPGRVYQLDELEGPAAEETEQYSEDEIAQLVDNLEQSARVSKSEHPTLEDIVRPLNKTAASQFSARADTPKAIERQSRGKEDTSSETLPAPSAEDPKTAGSSRKAQVTTPKRKRTMLRDTFIAVALSSCILGASVGAVYYFQKSNELNYSSDMLARARELAAKRAQEAKEEQDSIAIYSATIEQPDLSGSLEITVRDANPLSMNLSLTTPEPPFLTEEQVVSGKNRAPRLGKLLYDSAVFERRSPNSYISSGAGRAYIESSQIKSRYKINLVVIAEFDETGSQIKARILANRGFKKLPRQSLLFERAAGIQDFNVFLDRTFTAVKVKQADTSK